MGERPHLGEASSCTRVTPQRINWIQHSRLSVPFWLRLDCIPDSSPPIRDLRRVPTPSGDAVGDGSLAFGDDGWLPAIDLGRAWLGRTPGVVVPLLPPKRFLLVVLQGCGGPNSKVGASSSELVHRTPWCHEVLSSPLARPGGDAEAEAAQAAGERVAVACEAGVGEMLDMTAVEDATGVEAGVDVCGCDDRKPRVGPFCSVCSSR